MSLITSMAISFAILVFGSTGLAVLAFYLRNQADRKHRGHNSK